MQIVFEVDGSDVFTLSYRNALDILKEAQWVSATEQCPLSDVTIRFDERR